MSKERISVDVVIPVYFGLGLLNRLVISIFKQCDFETFDIKVIVVDDSANDPFHKLIKSYLAPYVHGENLVILKHDKNLGFIETCYTGIEYRKSKYKLLLNTDTLVLKDSLREMILSAENDEKIAIVNPITNNIPVIDVPMPNGFNIHDMKSNLYGIEIKEDAYIDIVTSVGFCALIKSEYIEKYGFFDRIFGLGYGEDTDLHFRYVKNGLRAVISPKSFIYHRGEGSFIDRDEKIIKATEIVFDRYQDLYDKTFPEFAEKTVLHKIRNEIIKKRELTSKILFFTKENSLANPEHRLAHILTNIFLERGISSNIVYKNQTVELSYLDDRLYSPMQLNSIDEYVLSPEILIVTEHSLYLEALFLATKSFELNGIAPKILYIQSSKNQDYMIAEESNLYDKVITINYSDSDETIPYPEILDVFSNIGLKKIKLDKQPIGIAFSSDMKFREIMKIAKSYVIEDSSQYLFYKFGNIDKSVKYDNVEISIIKWPQTGRLYELLKSTYVFINLSKEISISEIMLHLFSCSKILVGESSNLSQEFIEETDQIKLIQELDDIQTAEEIKKQINLIGEGSLAVTADFICKYSSEDQKDILIKKIYKEMENIEMISAERQFLVLKEILRNENLEKFSYKSQNEPTPSIESSNRIRTKLKRIIRKFKQNLLD